MLQLDISAFVNCKIVINWSKLYKIFIRLRTKNYLVCNKLIELWKWSWEFFLNVIKNNVSNKHEIFDWYELFSFCINSHADFSLNELSWFILIWKFRIKLELVSFFEIKFFAIISCYWYLLKSIFNVFGGYLSFVNWPNYVYFFQFFNEIALHWSFNLLENFKIWIFNF